MKKIVIFFVLLLTVLPISAQEVDALSEKGIVLVGRFSRFNIYDPLLSVRVLSLPERKDLCIGLANDMSGNTKPTYIRIEEPDWDAFENQMAIVDEKFEKWSQVAATGEKNFKKTIPVNFENVGIWSLGVTSYYESTSLYAVFEVDENGNCSLRLDKYEDKPSSHIPYFIFYTTEAFHQLYKLIKKENAIHNFELMQKAIERKKLQELERHLKYD